MRDEIWKWIPGWKGYYKVSNYGFIWCKGFEYQVPSRGGRRTIVRNKGMVLPYLSGGYRLVILGNGKGAAQGHKISNLVLNAFVGPCPPGKECCHGDDDRKNDNLDNLYWGTHIKNMKDRRRNGHSLDGTKNHNSKLQESDVLKIRRIYRKSKLTQRQLAKRYGLSRSTIHSIVSGETWKHI